MSFQTWVVDSPLHLSASSCHVISRSRDPEKTTGAMRPMEESRTHVGNEVGHPPIQTTRPVSISFYALNFNNFFGGEP